MQQLRLNSFIYIFAVSFLSAIYILPAVKIGFDYTRLSFILLLFYAVFIYKSLSITPIKKIVVYLLPYMFISFIVAKPNSFKLGFLHPLLITWCMLFPAVLCKNIIKRGNKKEMIVILTITLSMLLYVMYNTIGALADSADIMRELTAVSILDEELRYSYARANIGAYGIAYGSGAVAVLLITLMVNNINNKWLKVLIFCFLCYFLYFVFNAQFATLLFLTVFSSLMSLVYSEYGQNHKFQLLFWGIVLLFLTPTILQWLTVIYKGTTVGDKLLTFNYSIFGGGEISEFSGQRSKFQLDAFCLFVESPIWGSNVMSNQTNATIYGASHSTALGIACSTGLIGFISYYMTYWAVLVPILKDYTSTGRQYITLVLYFFCFSFFNPSESSEFSWIMFLITPLLYNVVRIVH